MSLNFLRWSFGIPGGGAPPLFNNPTPKRCAYVALINSVTVAWCLGALLYNSYVNSTFGPEIPHYLIVVAVLNLLQAWHFWHMTIFKQGSDDEWSKTLLHAALLCALQYSAAVWGCWLGYRMYVSQVVVGTRMYYYFQMGRWMYNSLNAISVLNVFGLIFTTYVLLRNILLGLYDQTRRRKFIR